ncbi:hypothetical protein E2C01_048234 [Portunus trituberculatus]|uniref:Uncharacterized protein n=1 Tax=Portunus trituberculatus TaxID=210409 RepID=A0A5B7GCR4_PORTR|nr:hypothetical protein [Portunus trituberculatus]
MVLEPRYLREGYTYTSSNLDVYSRLRVYSESNELTKIIKPTTFRPASEWTFRDIPGPFPLRPAAQTIW